MLFFFCRHSYIYMWTFFGYNLSLWGRPSYLYRNGFTDAPEWSWCVQNARFTTDALKMQMVPYNLSGLATEGLLSYIPNIRLHGTTLKGWISVDLEVMLHFHEFCLLWNLRWRGEEEDECVGKKDWGVHLFFFLVKWNHHVSFGYYLLKKRERKVWSLYSVCSVKKKS